MNLKSYWQYLFFKQITETIEHDMALDIIKETEFYPLDKNDCIIAIPEQSCYMCKTSKGFVIEYFEEISFELAAHLIKGNK